jgi:hypothetical protein
METWDIEARGLTKAFGSFTTLAYFSSLHFAGRKFESDWQKISCRL